MPEFAQVVITNEQATQLLFAAEELLRKSEGEDAEYDMTEQERADYQRLAVFLGTVAQHPNAFPVTGAYASKIKRLKRKVKGEAQPASRSKRRSGRHQRRRMIRREVRRNREAIEEFNRIQEIQDQERQEAEAYWAEFEARVEKQPKFTILSPTGQVMAEGIPAEFIQAEDGTTPLYTPVVLPGQ